MTQEIVIRKMHVPPCRDLIEHSCRLIDEASGELPWNLVRFLENVEAGFNSEQLDWDARLARERAQHEYEESLRSEPPGVATEIYGL